MDETLENLLLECKGYECAKDRMLEIVIEKTGVEAWN